MKIKINKLYTKSGDKGKTYLADGSCTEKHSLRVLAYGDVDELNSCFALLCAEDKENFFKSEMFKIQQMLFDIGAELATPNKPKEACVIENNDIEKIEKLIDRNLENLPELNSFIIPGGSKLNASIHLARTVCRRAERSISALSEQEELNSNILIYLNRLSDYLFACARREAFIAKRDELLWVKKENRE